MRVTPRGQSENPEAIQTGKFTLARDTDILIEQVVLATSMGCENFSDDDWVGTFNFHPDTVTGWDAGVATSYNFGMISQATTCFYLAHPLYTGTMEFILIGRI